MYSDHSGQFRESGSDYYVARCGYMKFLCFLREWDCKDRKQHYIKKEWSIGKTLVQGMKNIRRGKSGKSKKSVTFIASYKIRLCNNLPRYYQKKENILDTRSVQYLLYYIFFECDDRTLGDRFNEYIFALLVFSEKKLIFDFEIIKILCRMLKINLMNIYNYVIFAKMLFSGKQ